MKAQRLGLALVVWLCTWGLAWSMTITGGTVGGFIMQDTTWAAGGGPFVVSSSVLVRGGATLTIEPGVEVRFAPDRGIVVEEGSLIARGTDSARIKFTADVPDINAITENQRWGLIRFTDNAMDASFDAGGNYLGGSIISHAIVEGAGGTTLIGAIRADSAAPYISMSEIKNNLESGIVLEKADNVRVVGNQITGNGNLGLVLTSTKDVIVSDNTIEGSRLGVAVQNGIGTTIFENTIRDNSDTGVLLESGIGNSLLENLVTGNNNKGVEINRENGALLAGNAITKNTSFNPDGGGLIIFDSAVMLSGDVITDNETDGVRILQSPGGVFLSIDLNNPTQIFGNGGFQLANLSSFVASSPIDGPGNVDARNVFWNTLDQSLIDAGIFDFFDDVSKGIVFSTPFSAVVPEPGTAAVMAVGALFIASCRRRVA